MSKIIFDVTDLRKYISMYTHLSGIQRVMVMIIDDLAARSGDAEIWLGYCGDTAQDYQILPYSALGAKGMADIAHLAAALDQTRPVPLRPSLERYADQPLKRWFHARMRDHRARKGDRAYFIKRGTTLEAWQASARRALVPAAQGRPQPAAEICGPGDWLVMLDAGWTDLSWQAADNWRHRLRARGLRIALMVHDLIQIQNPEYIPGTDSLRFYKWLHSTLDTADVYLANSQATADDLLAFMGEHDARQPVHVLPLAQHPLDPPPTPRATGPAIEVPEFPARYDRLAQSWDMNDEVRAMLKWPYVLCVGTMDIRKNLWALAQVWQRLGRRSDIALPKLVLAGRRGSFNEDFNRLMQATGNLGGWVEIFNNASDRDLDFLYRNCVFTVMPSFYEGWGLPIGESLSYGKTAVVSQASSMPEVGLDLVEYCDPADMASIEAACLRLIADPAHRRALEERIARTRLRSWADVSADLMALLERDPAAQAGG